MRDFLYTEGSTDLVYSERFGMGSEGKAPLEANLADTKAQLGAMTASNERLETLLEQVRWLYFSNTKSQSRTTTGLTQRRC